MILARTIKAVESTYPLLARFSRYCALFDTNPTSRRSYRTDTVAVAVFTEVTPFTVFVHRASTFTFPKRTKVLAFIEACPDEFTAADPALTPPTTKLTVPPPVAPVTDSGKAVANRTVAGAIRV